MRKRIGPVPVKRTIRQELENFLWDLRYGGRMLDDEKLSPFYDQGCYHTQSTEYEELKNIFGFWELSDSDVIMDVGCGRGRVLNFLLKKWPKGKLYGVEIDPEIGDFTRKRLRKYSNVTIITGNSIEHIMKEVNIYFLFNPFMENLAMQFIERVEEIHDHVRLIYYVPQFAKNILARPGWTGTEKTYYSSIRRCDVSCYYLEYKKPETAEWSS